MDRYIKQIQTRMNRRLKSCDQSVTKQQVRDVYLTVVKNPDKPTDLEMSRVTELLAGQLSSPEDVISDGQLTVSATAENQEPTALEMTPEDTPDVWETSGSPAEQPQESALSRTEPESPAPLSGISHAESEEAAALAITQSGSNLPARPPADAGVTGITPAEMTAAIARAARQVGEQGNAEAVQLLTSLANSLSSEIQDTQEMAITLVKAYLGKRQAVLSSAISTINTLRSAQTESFSEGINEDFFKKTEQSKHQFLSQIETMFN